MTILSAPGNLPIIGQMTASASRVLAALGEIRAPRFLPDSLNGFLFETQWLYWCAAAALAAILFHLSRGRGAGQSRHLRLAATVLAIVTALWIAFAFVITTPRERLYRDHQALAAAAQRNDVDGILAYFAEDFRCSALAIELPNQAKDQLAARLKSYDIRSNKITAYTSDIFGANATTQLTVVTQAGDLPPIRTGWQLTWEDLPREDWRISRADLLTINGNPAPTDTPLPPTLPRR